MMYVVSFRFFFGKNRVMQLALGRSGAEEYKDGLHFVAKVLISVQGPTCLLLYMMPTSRSCTAIVVYYLPTPAVLM